MSLKESYRGRGRMVVRRRGVCPHALTEIVFGGRVVVQQSRRDSLRKKDVDRFTSVPDLGMTHKYWHLQRDAISFRVWSHWRAASVFVGSLSAGVNGFKSRFPDLVQDREQPNHHHIPARKCFQPAKFEGKRRVCT